MRMKGTLDAHLEKIRRLKRKHHHPLLHKAHKKHRISHKTLFYVKEYGPHSNVPRTIIRESIKILLFASIVSSVGGFALDGIKAAFISVMPLIILLPALNDMIGDYGTIASSRVSTMLHEGRMGSRPWRNPEIRGLFARIFAVAIITSLVCFAVSIAVSAFSGFEMSAMLALKVLLLTMADVIVLVGTVSTLSVAAGIHFFRKGEDPNNFLIPITTSVADFGNMLILSALVLLMF